MFSFSSSTADRSHFSVAAVMMVKDGDTVTAVNPRTKTILRLSDKSFRTLLAFDGEPISDPGPALANSRQEFQRAMLRNGLLEKCAPEERAYNVSSIRSALDSLADYPQPVILNPPALPTINVNERCRFKCPHCYNDTNRNSASEMALEVLVEKVLVPLSEMGCCNVMWSGGDPVLTREKTVSLTRIASSLGMSVATQAAEYSLQFLDEFTTAGGRGIQFSLYSSPQHPEIHDQFTRRVGSWSMTVRNIEEARRRGLAVFANMVLFPGNVRELSNTAQFADDLGVNVFRTTVAAETGRASQHAATLKLGKDAIASLLDEAVVLRDMFASHMDIIADISECGRPTMPYSLCNAGMTYAHVLDYKVFPCNFMLDDALCAGSIKDQTLDQIWRRSPIWRGFRAIAPIAPKCMGCNQRETVGGPCTDCKALMWMRFRSFLNPETVPCEITN